MIGENMMLRLHMNESPYPPPGKSVEYVSRYAQYLNLYYDEALYKELKNELSRYVGVERDFLEPLAGSSLALTLMLTYVKVGGLDLVTTHPTFHAIYRLVSSYGLTPKFLKLDRDTFAIDTDELLKTSEGRVVYIANPNNPTGNLLIEDPDILRAVASRAKALFIDETYYEFSGITFKDLVMDFNNIAVLRSFSKAFSLAGARFGYAIVSRELKKRLADLMIGYEISITTQAAAVGALKDLQYVKDVVREVTQTREGTVKKLREAGVRALDTMT
ncbi:MAG: histidinol-phosphate transaminase, partial [Zestosphaera sp.]